MSKYGNACDVDFVKIILNKAKEYKNEDDLWKNSEEFGKFVIDELQQLEEIEFEGVFEDEV